MWFKKLNKYGVIGLIFFSTVGIDAQIIPVRLSPTVTDINLLDYIDSADLDAVDYNILEVSDRTLINSTNFQIERDNAVININKIGTQLMPMYVLRIKANGKNSFVPLISSSKRNFIFKLPDSNHKYKSVKVKGTFNAWTASNLELTYEGGEWMGTSLISPGIEQYVFVIDGIENIDPTNKSKVNNGFGGFNSVIETKEEKLVIEPYGVNDSQVIVSCKNSADLVSLFCFDRDSIIFPELISNGGDFLALFSVPKKDGYNQLRIWAQSSKALSNDIWSPILDGRVIINSEVFGRVKDPRSMIIYNPMIDRFHNGNISNDYKINSDSVNSKVDYFGGDMAGIQQKLKEGYFKKLGVNTLWISPVIENPFEPWGQWLKPRTKFSGYHGYWPISLTKVDPRFGGEKDFNELINSVHQSKMRILVDYVAHHIHQDHPLYETHPEWFTSLNLENGKLNMQLWDEQRLTTWFDTFLPTFNFFNSAAVNALSDSAMYWVNSFEIDGFRHDATKHIPNPFWRSLTYKIKKSQRQKLNFFQIGETYGTPELISSYLGNGLLNSQFDFNIYDAAVAAFKSENGGCKHLTQTINSSLKWYGSNHMMGNITGNQDRPRFVSKADGSIKDNEDGKQAGWDNDIIVRNDNAYEKLQNLMAFNIMLPGIPVIYYGDEIGMPGGNDPDNRRMMRFDSALTKQEKENLNTFTRLLKIRNQSIALQAGSTKVSNPDDNTLIIRRKYFDIEEIVFVFYNGKEKRELDQIKKNFASYDMIFENQLNNSFSFTAIYRTKK